MNRPILKIVWPAIGERQWVTIGIFGLTGVLLAMAVFDPHLWSVEVFKVIIQAVVLTGLLNMVVAFHFASNKGSETARENTGKAFDAITAAATGQSPAPVGAGTAAQETADAAQDQADKIKGDAS